MREIKVLLGDIGGTNARLKIVDLSNDEILFQKIYMSHHFDSLIKVIEQFISDCQIVPESAYLAVAGRI